MAARCRAVTDQVREGSGASSSNVASSAGRLSPEAAANISARAAYEAPVAAFEGGPFAAAGLDARHIAAPGALATHRTAQHPYAATSHIHAFDVAGVATIDGAIAGAAAERGTAVSARRRTPRDVATAEGTVVDASGGAAGSAATNCAAAGLATIEPTRIDSATDACAADAVVRIVVPTFGQRKEQRAGACEKKGAHASTLRPLERPLEHPELGRRKAVARGRHPALDQVGLAAERAQDFESFRV